MGDRSPAPAPVVDPGGFANGAATCREADVTYYRLLKLAARGEIRTQITPFGHTLFSVSDARKFAGVRARA